MLRAQVAAKPAPSPVPASTASAEPLTVAPDAATATGRPRAARTSTAKAPRTPRASSATAAESAAAGAGSDTASDAAAEAPAPKARAAAKPRTTTRKTATADSGSSDEAAPAASTAAVAKPRATRKPAAKATTAAPADAAGAARRRGAGPQASDDPQDGHRRPDLSAILVEGARTRGQATAIAAVDGMLRGRVPHAVLLVGPDGVGKTTLALDLAAALLCTAEPSAVRPCRVCRACRLVEHGSHPDLHRLGPVGPGRQVVIGGSDPRARGVRDLLAELVLMPVEGGARVAIIEGADRMNEDAQSALLKTLEEPPSGVTIILCADQEARLLPTVRSRCARIRLGLVGARDIEAIVADHGLVDPPTASRLGRLAGGRPGIALAYARAPEAVLIRAELTRVLLDMTDARPSARLAAARAVVPRAMALVAALDPTATPTGPAKVTRRRGSAPAATATVAEPVVAPDPDAEPAPDAIPDEPVAGRAIPATERRRAVEQLLSLWADVARDVVLVSEGGARSVRDTVLLDELGGIAGTIPRGAAASFLDATGIAAERLASNVSPELILDALVLAWPRRVAAA